MCSSDLGIDDWVTVDVVVAGAELPPPNKVGANEQRRCPFSNQNSLKAFNNFIAVAPLKYYVIQNYSVSIALL